MKIIIILLSLVFLIADKAQTVYNVQPGSKSNEIELTISNLSATKEAQNVTLNLVKGTSSILFNSEKETIEKINPKQEKEVTFRFEIKRDAPINNKDTIEFKISYSNGTTLSKNIVINYIPPKEFRLEQNFPNPFNPTTTIQYQLPVDSKVTLKVYDILGREVKTLVNYEEKAGYKEVKFGGSRYASGVYIYRLIAESKGKNYTAVKKMMMIK